MSKLRLEPSTWHWNFRRIVHSACLFDPNCSDLLHLPRSRCTSHGSFARSFRHHLVICSAEKIAKPEQQCFFLPKSPRCFAPLLTDPAQCTVVFLARLGKCRLPAHLNLSQNRPNTHPIHAHHRGSRRRNDGRSPHLLVPHRSQSDHFPPRSKIHKDE